MGWCLSRNGYVGHFIGAGKGEAHRRKSYYSSCPYAEWYSVGWNERVVSPRLTLRAHIRIDATQEPTLRINQSKRSIRACDRSETRAILYATLSRGGIGAPVSAAGKWNREFDTVTYLIIKSVKGCAFDVRMNNGRASLYLFSLDFPIVRIFENAIKCCTFSAMK